MKQKKSDANVTIASYLISIAFHALLLLVVALFIGRVAGRAAGIEEKEYVPISVVYVPAEPKAAPEPPEPRPKPRPPEPVVEAEVEVVEVEQPEEEPIIVVEPEPEPETEEETSAAEAVVLEDEVSEEGESLEKSLQPEEEGEEGETEDGQGVSPSKFPNGIFAPYEQKNCNKKDDSFNRKGKSEYEVIFKEGRLEVELIYFDGVNRKTAQMTNRLIKGNFPINKLPFEPGGILRGRIVCDYECGSKNTCMMVEEQ